MSELPARTEVLVVGAGPVGLTVAASLAGGGHDVTVVDRQVAAAHTSRAAVVHAGTLEMLERIGVSGRFGAGRCDEPDPAGGRRPDGVAAALAGAAVTSPVADEHRWRLGRITDPAGQQWEVGHPLGRWPPSTAEGGFQ